MKKIKFYKRPIWKRYKIVMLAITLIKSYKIKYRIKINNHRCYAHPADKKIFIGIEVEDSIQDFLSTVMHEIAHIENFRNNKFFKYHNIGKNVKLTKQKMKDYKRFALRAEIYTDYVASKLMKKHFPEIPYRKGYTERNKKWFKTEILDQLIIKLRKILYKMCKNA